MIRKPHDQKSSAENQRDGKTDLSNDDSASFHSVPDSKSGQAEASAEVGGLDDGNEQLRTELADLKDKFLRTLAEIENVRRRAERDINDARQYAISRFAGDILGVADNLERALASVNAEERQTANALIDGIEMTRQQLLATLEKHGVKRIDPKGERFDPNYHEALYEVSDPAQPSGMVSSVVEPGYTLGNRSLRSAKVGITKNVTDPGSSQETGK